MVHHVALRDNHVIKIFVKYQMRAVTDLEFHGRREFGYVIRKYMQVYQEIDTFRKSIGRVSFSWRTTRKSSLCKCIILSQNKNIENILFKFLWGDLFTYFFLFKFPKAQQLI